MVAVAASAFLTGCSGGFPADPHGTLERAQGGTLRVGVADNPPWTDTDTDSGRDPSGVEVDLVERFAESIDAEIAWMEAGESALVRELEHGALDLVIGGILDETPWAERAAVTRHYTETTSERGERERRVMLVRMGENALLVHLERFLHDAEPQS